MHQMGFQKHVLYRERDESLIPDDELCGGLLKQFQPGSYPSQKYQLVLRSVLPEQKLETIMSCDSSPIEPRERLSDLLGDRAFLVSGLSSNADFHFQVLIEGLLASMSPDRKVEILRIDHSGVNDTPHPPISLAILVGGDWQVFYYIDAIGRMKSPVWSLLETFGNRINLTRIGNVDTNDLLRLCDRAFQYISGQLKAQKNLNGHLRGAIPELFAGLLLAKRGHHPVEVSLKLKLNRKELEIDAIGFRESEEGGECLLVEVKKRSTTQNELMSELEKFMRKVESVRKNSQSVKQALGYSSSIQKVSGLFITMADVGELSDGNSEEEQPNGYFEPFDYSNSKKAEPEFKDFLNGLSDVDFWDYNRFNSELKSAGLPKLPIKLLERANMVWELPESNVDE